LFVDIVGHSSPPTYIIHHINLESKFRCMNCELM
jgi:hypothetical protein